MASIRSHALWIGSSNARSSPKVSVHSGGDSRSHESMSPIGTCVGADPSSPRRTPKGSVEMSYDYCPANFTGSPQHLCPLRVTPHPHHLRHPASLRVRARMDGDNNGNPADNRVENLRWDTTAANRRDCVNHGNNLNAAKTHCFRGHPFTPDNVYTVRLPHRVCKTCARDRSRNQRAARSGQQ